MAITGIISALVVGLLIGALARLVVPGRQRIPIWLTIAVGVIGAIVGTFLAQVVGVAVTPGIDWMEIVLQVAVAAVGVVLAARMYERRGALRLSRRWWCHPRHRPGGSSSRPTSPRRRGRPCGGRRSSATSIGPTSPPCTSFPKGWPRS